MIVSILPAAQLSQIELLFTPYTHHKMHFLFVIDFRIFFYLIVVVRVCFSSTPHNLRVVGEVFWL